MYVYDPTCSIYVPPYALFLISCCEKLYNFSACIRYTLSGSYLSWFRYFQTAKQIGAWEQDWTADLFLTKETLYHWATQALKLTPL